MTLVGQHIGRYRILEQVGSGGMSVVYRGLDTALEREVAVKVLHPHLALKEDSRRRLTREAKAVAKLQHPNILEVFDFAAVDAQNAYIVTEYIHGQTLAEHASRRNFDPPEIAAMVVHEVAAALAHAHEAGVIHRDLKPENVMIRNDGVIKLMDFGIAKVIDRDDRMTMTGALVGSPAHMAPEIIEGEEAGPEADVFSLGTILYYLAARQLPFTAPNTTAVLKKILDTTYEDPRKLVPSISDELTAIIGNCLARDPAGRYPHAGKLRDALAGYLAEMGLTRVGEELGWFFADPLSYRRRLSERLCEILVRRSHQFVAEKRPAKALACLNQALALDSGHAGALQAVEEINRSRRRQRAVRRRATAALLLASVALLVAAGYFVGQRIARTPDYRPMGNRLAEVVVPESSFPAASGRNGEKDAHSDSATTSALPLGVRGVPSPKARSGVSPERATRSPAGKLVHFTIQFRPYAYVGVDGGDRLPELPQHDLELTPGRHRLRYGCRFCEERTQAFDVPVDGTGLLRLLVQPKPSKLVFNFAPPDAMVELGGERRAAAETEAHPFRVQFPMGVTQQKVEFEVTRPGFKPSRGAVTLLPDNSQVVQGSLVAE